MLHPATGVVDDAPDRVSDAAVRIAGLADTLEELYASESPLTTEELDALEARAELEVEPIEERTAPVWRSLTSPTTILGRIDVNTAPALFALVERKCGRPGDTVFAVSPDGAVSLLPQWLPMGPDEAFEIVGWIAEHRSAAAAAKAAAAPAETRVSVAGGGRFLAEARLAGGRWVKAGKFPTEPQASLAAQAKAAELLANTTPARAA
jgi:hypothetical protein